MAAGLGFKTFTTGEVLTANDTNGYLMQGVLVFASSAARASAVTSPQEGQYSYLKDTNSTEYYDGAAWIAAPIGDITGVTAGTGISGGGTSGTVTITNSMATEITAKGDLIAGTGSATFDNLAAGANGETLVADSSTTTGLRYQGDYAAGKNKIINGDFSVNQRNASSSSTTNDFVFDRWVLNLSGGTGTQSSQAFTPGTAPVAGYEGTNFSRIITTTGNDYCSIAQKIEDVRTFAGQTVTVSFWAKGTNPTTEGGVYVWWEQQYGTGGSATTGKNQSSKIVLTASWTRYSVTASIASLTGKTIGTSSYIVFGFGQGSSTSTDGFTLDFWGVQVEDGSVATAFQTATGTLQGELAACQRYYQRRGGGSTASASVFGLGFSGQCNSTTVGTMSTVISPRLRTTPTLAISGSIVVNVTGLNAAVSGLGANYLSVSGGFVDFNTSGLTAGQGCNLIVVSDANAYIEMSAEL